MEWPPGGVAIADLDGDGTLDLAQFDGASSGILAQDDFDEAGAALQPGSAAAILVYDRRLHRLSRPRPRPTSSPSSSNLGELRDSGILTDAEFEKGQDRGRLRRHGTR